MEPLKPSELSTDEKLSPIKFAGLRGSRALDSKAHQNASLEQICTRSDSNLQNSGTSMATQVPQSVLIHRRNTIQPDATFKTPSKVLRHTSMTSPRRDHLSATKEAFMKSPTQDRKRHRPSESLFNTSASFSGDKLKEKSLAATGWRTSGGPLVYDSLYRMGLENTTQNGMASNSNNISFAQSFSAVDAGNSYLLDSSEVAYGSNSLPLPEAGTKDQEQQTPGKLQNRELKPLFSVLQFNQMQADHLLEMRGLESTISGKNMELIKLTKRVSDLERDQIVQQEALIKKENELSRSKMQERGLQIQVDQHLNQIQRVEEELNSKVSSFRADQSLLTAMKEDLEYKLGQEVQARSHSNRKLKETEEQLLSIQASLTKLVREHQTVTAHVGDISEENESLKKRIKTMLMDEESARTSRLALEEELFSCKESIGDLKSEVEEKELSLNNLRKKFGTLTEETQILHDEMLHFETAQREMEKELSLKVSHILELQVSEEKLNRILSNQSRTLDELSTSKLELKEMLLAKEMECGELRLLLATLKSQNDEKDKIISGDTKKLTELVQQVTEQKNLISDQKAKLLNLDNDAELSSRESEERIMSLRKQISQAQEKTDQRIQEVAEQLYHQYSKKHEAKVAQLKLRYESKLEEKEEEAEQNERLLESLQSQLRTEQKEKTYLLSVLEKGETVNNNNFGSHSEGVV